LLSPKLGGILDKDNFKFPAYLVEQFYAGVFGEAFECVGFIYLFMVADSNLPDTVV
jgi:hypothetical protein